MKKIVCLFIILLALLSCFSIISYAETYYDYYIVNKTSNKFHLPNCSYLPEPSNRYKISCDEIDEYSNLTPCKKCNPLRYSSSNSQSSSNSNKTESNSTDKTWVERKMDKGTPLLDIIAGIFLFIVMWISGALFFELISQDDSCRCKLSWFGKIFLAALCILSALFLLSAKNVDGSAVIKMFVNATPLIIIYIAILIPSTIWTIVNIDNLL